MITAQDSPALMSRTSSQDAQHQDDALPTEVTSKLNKTQKMFLGKMIQWCQPLQSIVTIVTVPVLMTMSLLS